MSEAKHTPEPWRAPAKPGAYGFRDYTIFDDVGADREVCLAEGLTEADAARIVACVNALAGMNPEAVAELVEAASVVEAVMGLGEFPSPEKRAALGAALAALKVER
jgi:hypothetical protein